MRAEDPGGCLRARPPSSCTRKTGVGWPSRAETSPKGGKKSPRAPADGPLPSPHPAHAALAPCFVPRRSACAGRWSLSRCLFSRTVKLILHKELQPFHGKLTSLGKDSKWLSNTLPKPTASRLTPQKLRCLEVRKKKNKTNKMTDDRVNDDFTLLDRLRQRFLAPGPQALETQSFTAV